MLSACLMLTQCAHDTYQQRADLIKKHSEAFYSHLKANRVEAAIRENEMIEAMAGQMGDTVKKTAARQGTASVEREFSLMKTANEAAATNWLALGQYFAIKKLYPQARATYQRVIDTYTNPTDRLYREKAIRALNDLDILNPGGLREPGARVGAPQAVSPLPGLTKTEQAQPWESSFWPPHLPTKGPLFAQITVRSRFWSRSHIHQNRNQLPSERDNQGS